jgi:hypothetical protein
MHSTITLSPSFPGPYNSNSSPFLTALRSFLPPKPPFFGTTCAGFSFRGPRLSRTHRTLAQHHPHIPLLTVVPPRTNAVLLLLRLLPYLANAAARRVLTQCHLPVQRLPLAFLPASHPPLVTPCPASTAIFGPNHLPAQYAETPVAPFDAFKSLTLIA